MIHQLDFEGRDKVDIAIDRYRDAAKITGDEGLYLCFSGGKDSCVIKALADMAGVKYDAFRKLYLNAFAEMLKYREETGKETEWKTPEDVMRWWVR